MHNDRLLTAGVRAAILAWTAWLALSDAPLRAAGVAATQEPDGYYVLENTDSLEPVDNSTLQNHDVAGVVLRRRWMDVNPSSGHYDWSYFDQEIAHARNYGKKVQLVVLTGVSSPNWLYGLGAQKMSFTDPRESKQVFTMPVPWDPVMLSNWGKCVTAMGARYDGDPTVTMVYAAGPCRFSCEMYVPDKCTTLSGWSIPTLIGAWDQCINFYNGAFHSTAVSFNLSHAVNNNDGVPQSVAAQATKVLGARATLQQDSLSDHTSSSYDVQALVVSYSKKGTRTGYEMLGPSSSARFGGSFGGAVSIGRKAGGQFINIYQPDVSKLTSPY